MIYLTADLHGIHPKELEIMLEKAGFYEDESNFLFILGDVIDRGEYGAELLVYITQQPSMQLILGNHEALMLACAFLFDELTEDSLDWLSTDQMMLVESWIQNGGGPTMTGLGKYLKKDPDIITGVLEYLEEAPLYETVAVNGREFILVHAGLGNDKPKHSLDEYDPDELLHVRPEITTNYYSDATVVFGHTPTVYYGKEYDGKAVHTSTWICIDTGAAMGKQPMLLRLDDMKEFY